MFNPQFWGWLFQGESLAEYTRLPVDKQEQVVKATLRLLKHDARVQWMLDLTKEPRSEQPPLFEYEPGEYRVPLHINTTCTIINRHYIPLAVA